MIAGDSIAERARYLLFNYLSCLLLHRQPFFRRTFWLIPLFFLISAVLMVSSFAILGHITQ